MKNKKALLAAAVLIAAVAVALTCWLLYKPQAAEGEKSITVEITHKDETVNVHEIVTNQKYLYGAMEEAGIIGELTDGYFVEVDGETADTQAQEWWGYTKSGEYVNYGAADCVISDGDHYEFTFHVGW